MGKKKVIFTNCGSFTGCIGENNNTKIDNAKGIEVVMLVHDLIEYNNNYSKTSGPSWLFYKDELALDNNGGNVGFAAYNAIDFFRFKVKVTGQTA